MTLDYVAGVDLRGSAGRDASALLERVVGLYRARSTDQAEGQRREPVRNYLDPDRWRREIERVHRRVPLPLALSCELIGPGSYQTIEVAGTPVLITRDARGTVHAMVNTCRHRGAELLGEGRGCLDGRIVCLYCAWTYDVDGSLVTVPGERTFGPGLRALPVTRAPARCRAAVATACAGRSGRTARRRPACGTRPRRCSG